MRNRRVEIRLSEKEYEILLSYAASDPEIKCRRDGSPSLSAYIRKCVFYSGEHPENLKKEWKETNYQIRKIGVNINQIAHKFNAELGSNKDISSVLCAIDKVFELMEKLNETYGKKLKEEDADGNHQDDAH